MNKFLNVIKRILSAIFHRNPPSTQVYTIGDYDLSQVEQGKVMKLGPLSKEDIHEAFPKSFLEIDGCYAGGEAFSSEAKARDVMTELRGNGILPEGNWRVYLLNATWERDVYRLRDDDYRINKDVLVLQQVSRYKL